MVFEPPGAKQTAADLGLPLVPGSSGAVTSIEEITALGDKVGYPVLVKAVAGGGGRGMKVIERADQAQEAFDLARNEAKSAFGNDSLYGSIGNDSLDASGTGASYLDGESGNDTLRGGAGNDTFADYQGDNSVDGGGGADLFQNVGFSGNDTFTGGVAAHQDSYVLNWQAGSTVEITDF